jgi:DNA-directed RNA polymerase subunit RPC12/RpoP
VTKEIRTLIELQDILGVEIECNECKAKVMMPIGSKFPRLDGKCSQCGKQLFGANVDINSGVISAAAMKQINELMSQIQYLTSKERSDIHIPIRLHIMNALVSDHASNEKD